MTWFFFQLVDKSKSKRYFILVIVKFSKIATKTVLANLQAVLLRCLMIMLVDQSTKKKQPKNHRYLLHGINKN